MGKDAPEKLLKDQLEKPKLRRDSIHYVETFHFKTKQPDFACSNFSKRDHEHSYGQLKSNSAHYLHSLQRHPLGGIVKSMKKIESAPGEIRSNFDVHLAAPPSLGPCLV